MPTVSIVDLRDNKITDPSVIDEVFAKMPNLKVLYLQKNDFIKKVKQYRRTMISKCKFLTYLDDRPVFKNDRRLNEAWVRGGLPEERAER